MQSARYITKWKAINRNIKIERIENLNTHHWATAPGEYLGLTPGSDQEPFCVEFELSLHNTISLTQKDINL